MTQTTDDEAFVAQTSAMLALTLDNDRWVAVTAAFAAYREAAALLLSFPLPEATEPASVYTLEDARDGN